MDDLYVTFTDYDYLRTFRDHPDFVRAYEYDPVSRTETFREEYGKLRLKRGLNLHLILDACPVDKSCPWCEYPEPEIVIKENENKIPPYITFKGYAFCPKCSAKGPDLNIHYYLDDEGKKWTEEYLLQRWSQRKPKKYSKEKIAEMGDK